MVELWKNIKGFENFYQISDCGRVKSLSRKRNDRNQILPERILKCGYDKKGYKQVILCKNGKCKTYTIHRLVAQAFIENPYNYNYVNHKNENKEDNRVKNLEWCTNSYNLKYGNAQKNKKRKINQYDKNNNFVKEWGSMLDIQNQLSIPTSNICKVCNGKRKFAGGYIWRYATNI